MVDITRKLWQPATVRKELLNTINNNVLMCNGISNIRLNNCKVYENSPIEVVRDYLNTQRISLFRRSHQIQREFDALHIRLM